MVLSFSTPITIPTSYISMCSLVTCFFQKTCITFFVVVHKTLAQIPSNFFLKSTSIWTTWHTTHCMVWGLHELIFSLSWTTTKKLMLPYAWYKKNFWFFDWPQVVEQKHPSYIHFHIGCLMWSNSFSCRQEVIAIFINVVINYNWYYIVSSTRWCHQQ